MRPFDIHIHTDNLLLSPVGPRTASINLSKATRLKDVAFWHGSQDISWVIRTLRTITPEHQDLRQISIHLPSHLTSFGVGTNIRQAVGEAVAQWLDLDHLLVQFWESRSIRPRVECMRLGEKQQNAEYCVECLLPEMTERGITDLVEYRKRHWK